MAPNSQVEALLPAGLDVDFVHSHERGTLLNPVLMASGLWWTSHCLPDLVLQQNLLVSFASHLWLCGGREVDLI